MLRVLLPAHSEDILKLFILNLFKMLYNRLNYKRKFLHGQDRLA